MKMRILHIGDIAQQASYLAQAQRALGHDAVTMAQAIDSARFGMRRPDIDVDVRHGVLYPLSWNRFIFRRRRFIDSFDVLHVHGGIRRWQLAYAFVEPPIVAHMHGTETRQGFGLHHLKWARVILFSTPDLAEHLPRGRWLPQAVPDIPHGPASFERLRILHAPTDPEKKDTQDIVRVVTGLRPNARWRKLSDHRLLEDEGVEFRVTDGPVPHARLLTLIEQSNLVVDHLGSSPTLGISAIEAMLMERPAAAGFSRSAYAKALEPYGYREPPVFHVAGPSMLEESLRKFLDHPGELTIHREEARRYARTVHDPIAVARQASDVYMEASQRV